MIIHNESKGDVLKRGSCCWWIRLLLNMQTPVHVHGKGYRIHLSYLNTPGDTMFFVFNVPWAGLS